MTTQQWKKRYSFRLKKGDQELYELLEGLPDSKRSETIRQMLLFACRTITEEKQQKNHIEYVMEELKGIRKMTEKNHQELLSQLSDEKTVFHQEGAAVMNEKNPEQLTDRAMTESAAAMISSFGMPE